MTAWWTTKSRAWYNWSHRPDLWGPGVVVYAGDMPLASLTIRSHAYRRAERSAHLGAPGVLEVMVAAGAELSSEPARGEFFRLGSM